MRLTLRLDPPEAYLADAPVLAAWQSALLDALDAEDISELDVIAGSVYALVEGETEVWHRRALSALAHAELAGSVSSSPALLADWESTWLPTPRPFTVGMLGLMPKGWQGEQLDAPALTLAAERGFGTGGHPTTSMILARLQELAPEGHVLDLGTGNGVLGLAALLLGATHATCTDIDAAALDEARENAAFNGLASQCDFSLDPVPCAPGSVSLLVANLHAGPAIQLQPRLSRALAPGARIVLTGFSPDQVEPLLRAWQRAGARCWYQAEEDGWALLELIGPG